LLILETGLRIGDALALTKINFHGNDGDYFLKFTAQKTGKPAKRPISKILYESITKRKTKKYFIVRKQVWFIPKCGLEEI